jgi:hypothetical protein
MSETKGRNREDTNRGCCLSIALHPFLTRPQSTRHFSDDSGQVLDLAPNRRGFSHRCDFGGQQFVDSALPAEKKPLLHGRPKLLGIARSATHGLRTSTKKD